VIDKEQAVIVRLIYQLFLVEGKSISGIANDLTKLSIKTPSGKTTKWTKNTVNSILTNEKYKGDALLQKSYTEDYLNQKIVKNTGQIPQYYVENNHPAIIDRDTWESVQIELSRRDDLGTKYSSNDIFASKLICEDCGGFYGQKKWHSNTKYSRFIHQCNRKFEKGKDKCTTPNLTDSEIKQKFIEAYNITMKDKKRIIDYTNAMIALLTDTTQLDNQIDDLYDEMVVITELINKLIKDNSKSNMSQDEYEKKYLELTSRYEQTKKRQEELIEARNNKKAQELNMRTFIANLSKAEDKITAWNESIWMLLVKSAVVHRDKNITFIFNNGKEIRS
ncbi:MAG: recombinase family protein, partial [Erysipelotrichales bacterium]|nr:recombinase family protein [Erysipelotrichales bacterium]